MAEAISLESAGVSPRFTITNEDLLLRYVQRVSRIPIDGVQPPLFGDGGGASVAMRLVNQYGPWVDEKIIEPKFDGICKYLGLISNNPTPIRDYHFIALMRATDRALAPTYEAYFTSQVDSVGPYPQVPEEEQ